MGEDATVLDEELARTGLDGQNYSFEEGFGRVGGPAFLVYYSPALMQKGGAADPLGAMQVLAEILRRARELNPLDPTRAHETVTVRIDALKDLPISDVICSNTPGEVWVLTTVSSQD